MLCFVLILKQKPGTLSPVDTESWQINFDRSHFLLDFFGDFIMADLAIQNINQLFYCSETTFDRHLIRLSKKTENLIDLLDSLVEFKALKNRNKNYWAKINRFITLKQYCNS